MDTFHMSESQIQGGRFAEKSQWAHDEKEIVELPIVDYRAGLWTGLFLQPRSKSVVVLVKMFYKSIISDIPTK